MITKKNIFLIIIIIKYAILLRFVPNLEVERYTNFFQQCTSFLTCINPYTGIENLDNQLGLTNSQSPKVEEQNESKDLEESQSPKEEQDDSSVNDKKNEDK